MKSGIIVRTAYGTTKNLGDYVQSISQEQFFEHADYRIEREEMDSFYSDERVKVIMGAWFMTDPSHFPPSECIDPLFVSFHMFPKIAEGMLSPKGIEYLKTHEPIGARDIRTKEILEEHGIKSYFSSCLTLTLGYKYKDTNKNDDIIFVDPVYQYGGGKHKGLLKYIDASFLFLKHPIKVLRIQKRFKPEFWSSLSRISKRLDNILLCASFYDAYSKSFSDDILMNAKFVNHRISIIGMTEDDIFEYTRNLIKDYAKAKLVVTSRLHCALPCLGIETPVVFVTSDSLEKGELRGAGRLTGNLELLNHAKLSNNGVYLVSDTLKEVSVNGKLTSVKIAPNPEDYKTYRDRLMEKVNSFIRK